MEQSGDQALTIETVVGQLDCQRAGDGQIAVDIAATGGGRTARRSRRQRSCDARRRFAATPAASAGNPHAVFFVADAEAVDLAVSAPDWKPTRCFRRAPISSLST